MYKRQLSDRGKLLQNVKTDKNIQDCFLLHRRGFLPVSYTHLDVYKRQAFEIKTACDEISRRLLRWHWERKPGAHLSVIHI